MINRLFFFSALYVFLTVAARAQDFPRAEIFGGYSYANLGPVISGGDRRNFNGWNAILDLNVNRWFGVATDFGGLYGSSKFSVVLPIGNPACPTGGCSINTSETDKFHNFLFGPQFSLRTKKLTPFVHALFGGAHRNLSATTTFIVPSPGGPFPQLLPPTVVKLSTSTTNFSLATGGGVDYNFSDKLGWRVQADYLQIGIPNRTLNNFRLSTGIVFHF